MNVKKGNLLISLDIKMQNKDIDIYAGDEYLLSAKAGKTGIIKIKKNNPIGRSIIEKLNKGSRLRVLA